jgi:hypothetical protein
MKRAWMSVLSILTAVSLAASDAVSQGDSIERPFAEGGVVRLRLASGDYTLRAGASDRIVVRWAIGDEARIRDLQKLSVDVKVAGGSAFVDTKGPARHVDFTIEVPTRSDVHLRMRAGDVRIDGIEGNKDIRMTAGELNIGIEPASLSRARASVTFGDLEARPLGIAKSGARRSFKWAGTGVYTLDARLLAGDLTLSQRNERRSR